MKKCIAIFSLIALTSCLRSERKPAEQKMIETATMDSIVKDSVAIVFVTKDSTVSHLREPVVSVNYVDTIMTLRRSYDSLKRRNDTVWSKLLFANNKIEAVKTYIRIAERNPSQRGFFRGWINALWPEVK